MNFIEKKYHLKESVIDAFSSKSTRSDHTAWWINRETELKAWKTIIDKASKTNINYIHFIIGNYGRGKTLSLLKIIELAEDYKTILPIFINFKSEEPTKSGVDVIFKIIRGIKFKELGQTTSIENLLAILKSFPENLTEVRNTLKAIYFSRLDVSQANLFSNVNQTSKGNLSEVALNFIKGYITPSSTQLKELNVLRKIDKVDIAKEYLAGILLFLNKLNLSTLLIAIDEFEGLFTLVAKSQQSIYIALLRSLYDFPMGVDIKEKISNMIFFVGSSEAGWSSLKDMESKEQAIGGPTVPLMDRIDKPTVLGVFNKKETYQLIEKRLTFNRVDGKFTEKPIIPFTEDFVDYIYELTQGEPRQILTRCASVLDVGVAEKISHLNKKFAIKVLEENF